MMEKPLIDEKTIKFYVLVTKVRKKNLVNGIASSEDLNKWMDHAVVMLINHGMEEEEAKKIIQEASEYDPEF